MSYFDYFCVSKILRLTYWLALVYVYTHTYIYVYTHIYVCMSVYIKWYVLLITRLCVAVIMKYYLMLEFSLCIRTDVGWCHNIITDEVENASSPPKCSKTVTEDCDAVERTSIPSPCTPLHLMTQLHLSTPCNSAVTCTQTLLQPKSGMW
jgi:hypothetical protein